MPTQQGAKMRVGGVSGVCGVSDGSLGGRSWVLNSADRRRATSVASPQRWRARHISSRVIVRWVVLVRMVVKKVWRGPW